jgi:hypothetical protein
MTVTIRRHTKVDVMAQAMAYVDPTLTDDALPNKYPLTHSFEGLMSNPVRAVPCSFCHADKGFYCVEGTFKQVIPHNERLDAYTVQVIADV